MMFDFNNNIKFFLLFLEYLNQIRQSKAELIKRKHGGK